MLGLGQIISFIANEGKFKFKSEHSIQNSINIWPGMIQQTYHSGLEMWIREKNNLVGNELNILLKQSKTFKDKYLHLFPDLPEC